MKEGIPGKKGQAEEHLTNVVLAILILLAGILFIGVIFRVLICQRGIF